jgi:hypothetical protein
LLLHVMSTRVGRDAEKPFSPPPERAATIEKLKHKLGTTLTMYELACQRPGGDKDDPKGEVHRFTFQDHKLMVDTEQVSDDGSRANYVYPEQKILAVLDERAIMRKAVEEVHKAKATALKPLDREWDGVIAAKMKELKCGKKLPPEELAKLAPVKAEIDERRAAVAAPFDARVKALKDGVTDPARGYSYNDASWTKEQWAQVARDVATKPDAPDDIEKATMFVASMIVEASRFPISDVATLLILGDPNNPDAPIFDELPMTGGGTIKDPPDPTLPDAGGRATPSGEVTDAVVDLAKTTYQRSTGDSLPDEIGRRIDAGEDEPAIRTHIKGVLTANFFKG